MVQRTFRGQGCGWQLCQRRQQEGSGENNKTQLTWQEAVLGAGALRAWSKTIQLA